MRSFHILISGLLCFAILRADWDDHPHLPANLQRGAARFLNGISGSWGHRLLEEDLPGLGFTLFYSTDEAYGAPQYPKPELVYRYFKSLGMAQAFYICPTTLYIDNKNALYRGYDDIWWSSVFDKYPYAAAAAACDPDGKRKTAYSGFWTRNVSSRASDKWAAHISSVMKWMSGDFASVKNEHLRKTLRSLSTAGLCDAFYLDNPGLIVSYDALSLEKFRAYTTEMLGRHEDPRKSQDAAIRIAWQNFQFRTHADYFKKLKVAAHSLEPPRVIWTNYAAGAEREISDARAIDIVYSENTLNAPPNHWNIYDFKKLLALQKGGPVGISYYAYPSWTKLDPQNEYRILSWSARPEFVCLGIAEGMSSGGSHILHPGSILYHRDWAAQIKTYLLFQKRNERLFSLAKMGSTIAMVYPSASAGRGSPDLMPAARHIASLGYPFEIILETDLTREILARNDFKLLIVPHAHCLDAPRVDALKWFAEQGGTVLVSQHFAERNELGYPQSPEIAANLLGRANSGRFLYNLPLDAELEGFVPGHSGRITLPVGNAKEGRAWVTFQGADGDYEVGVQYYDEWDGESTGALLVNDKEVDRWKYDGEDKLTWRVVKDVPLRKGDRIGIYGKQDMGEWCRIYNLRVSPAAFQVSLSETPTGKGRIVHSPEAIESWNEERLRRLLSSASNVRADFGAGERVTVNALRTKDRRALTLHLLNHTIQSGESYTAFLNEKAVARIQLPAPEPSEKDDLYFGVIGYHEHSSGVKVSVNGREPIALQTKARGKRAWMFKVSRKWIQPMNTIEVRGGNRNSHSGSFFCLYIDPEKELPASEWSPDGENFSSTDLSHLKGQQMGAYRAFWIASGEKRPSATFHVRLKPVENVRLTIEGDEVRKGSKALLISPDHAPMVLPLSQANGKANVTIPSLTIYSALVLSADAEFLNEIEKRNHPPYYKGMLPRSRAWVELSKDGIVGNRLRHGDIEGDLHVSNLEGLKPESLKGRSHKTRGASWVKKFERGRDWDIVDGHLVRISSTRKFHNDSWWDYTSNAGATVSEHRKLWTKFRGNMIAPPGFFPMVYPKPEIKPCIGADPKSHGVSVTGLPGGGLRIAAEVLDTGRDYAIQAWTKVNRGEMTFRITGLPDGEQTRKFSNREWQQSEHKFQSDGKQIHLLFQISGPEKGSFHLDKVSVREVVAATFDAR